MLEPTSAPMAPVMPPQPVAPAPAVAATPAVDPLAPTPTTKELKRQADLCRIERAEIIKDWTDSVEFHRGKPFSEESDSARIAINKDWPRVKARVSSLFGQMPEVRLVARQDMFAPSIPVFGKELNDTLKRADTFEAIFQALVDNTATAGVGVIMVSYQKRTDMVPAPLMDTSTIAPDQLAQMGAQIPTQDTEVVTDTMFSVNRLSPSDLLWQTGFGGFNFDKSDWVGHTGEMSWAEGQSEFHLKDEDKEKVLGDGKEIQQTLKQNDPNSHFSAAKQPVVEFDELFYWAYKFDAKEKYYKRIRRIVFVKGMGERPVVHEDWVGQKFHEDSGSYVGACKFPIRVLKINYVSDDPIPPSESAIGRPQVLELIESRTDQHNQRKHRIPTNWVNTNKVDPETLVQLMAGTWQGWIPVNGRGEDAIGELGHANYPAENSMFDRTVNQDLDEVWQTSANQTGSFASGERSASEAKIVQGNFDMRNGMDRTHVAKFIQGIAEVMAGFLALYGDFHFLPPADLQRMEQAWDRKQVAGEFAYEVIPDSMIRLDAHQQIQMLMEILNMTAKSGFVNPQPLISDIMVLAGRDPAKVVTQPNPPPPPPLKITIASAADLHDPLMLALLMDTGQMFKPEMLEAAKQILVKLTEPALPPQPPLPPGGAPGGQAPPGAPPAGPPPTDSATAPQDMNVMSKISKRGDYN